MNLQPPFSIPSLALNFFFAFGVASAAMAASGSFSEWRTRQSLSVDAPGLLKLSLPETTLDSAQPGLADLRILDPSSAEVPYALESP
jgi:hypothetical protein